jgi:Zn-dependent M28 family amino/carboxypeptidase
MLSKRSRRPLEIGRVLAGHRAAHDLRLILFGGEEQGLYGSRQYVEALPASERSRVRTVINMDMVATLNTPEAAVLLEGAGVSQRLMDELAAAAATYT